MEYVSKGNLEEEDLRNEINGEMYVLDNNEENYSNEINGNFVEEENIFEVRNNGFIKNSVFNTDKEVNIAEVTSEMEKLKFADKIEADFVSDVKGIEDEKEKEEYNDLFFWNKNSIIAPVNLEFFDDL